MEAVAQRLEARLPVAVRVDLWSLDVRQRAQECITEKHSAPMAARVVSSKAVEDKRAAQPAILRRDASAPRARGLLRAAGSKLLAIGLQLLAATGNWN